MKSFLIITLLIGSCFSLEAQSKKAHDPIEIFEELWATFDLRYANFELKEVDWDEVYQKYQPRITTQTSESELFNICCQMLQELRDGHVGMEAEINDSLLDCGTPYAFSLEEEFSGPEGSRLYNGALVSTLDQNGFSALTRIDVSEETNFQFSVSEDYGYLRMDEMTESVLLGKLKKALDQSFEAFADKRGIIIDLRFNGGGWDKVSYELAGRLVTEQQTGHYKKTRIKGTNQFTDLREWRLKPTSTKPFTKPVVVLTSDYTASAAEVFLLATKDLRQVKIVGDTTEGIFSDMYEFKLANKWGVSLSHQQFFSHDMVNYEGLGVPPDIQVTNTRITALEERDIVIERALKALRNIR